MVESKIAAKSTRTLASHRFTNLGSSPMVRPISAMKLIRGQSLAKLLEARPIQTKIWPRLIQIVEQIITPSDSPIAGA